MTYRHTHVCYFDGSPAMEIPQTDYPYSIVLENEDGHRWIDPAGWWIPIGDEQPEDYSRWADLDDNHDDYDPAMDYPSYDPQTSFYEATGRLPFPNEY